MCHKAYVVDCISSLGVGACDKMIQSKINEKHTQKYWAYLMFSNQ